MATPHATENEGGRPSIFNSATHEIVFVSTIIFAQLLTQAGLGMFIIPLQIIGEEVHVTDIGQLSWFAAAYSLTSGIFILITGRLEEGDVFGHRKLLVIGYLWFCLTSIAVGMAGFVKGAVYLSIFRALQGIGPATILPNGIALLARSYPPGKRKASVFSLLGASAPSGFIVGGVFGGLFAQLVWWPYAQWLLAATCFALSISAHFSTPKELRGAVQPEGKIDILGAVLAVASLVLVVYAFNEGPATSWGNYYVFVPLIVGVLVIAGFFVYETFAAQPIMPPSVWTQSGFPGVLLCIALGWSSFGIWVFYIVQIMEVIRGATPLLAVAQMSPVIVGGLLASLVVAKLHHRLAPRYLMAIAMTGFCAANILCATVPADQIYWGQIFVATLIAPFGMDVSFPAASLIVSDSIKIEQQGVAASLVSTVLNVAVSLGLGLGGTIESKTNEDGENPLKGFHNAFYLGVALSGLGFVCAFVFCGTGKELPEEGVILRFQPNSMGHWFLTPPVKVGTVGYCIQCGGCTDECLIGSDSGHTNRYFFECHQEVTLYASPGPAGNGSLELQEISDVNVTAGEIYRNIEAVRYVYESSHPQLFNDTTISPVYHYAVPGEIFNFTSVQEIPYLQAEDTISFEYYSHYRYTFNNATVPFGSAVICTPADVITVVTYYPHFWTHESEVSIIQERGTCHTFNQGSDPQGPTRLSISSSSSPSETTSDTLSTSTISSTFNSSTVLTTSETSSSSLTSVAPTRADSSSTRNAAAMCHVFVFCLLCLVLG
ncbi:hypothetical protein PROFUN_10694 [Planoprotostelium fungivorum]|uniref:Major facilitator superfamily (MFS) profile domain-containing protein n=1 Tax=Planoprotostelium fungivorum TaxID=1890364 RepID=A0A2P6N9N1_9EUKA|nr:hypothetical protein PROFUN_10694 [Planoprotostelium fungivorum]